MMEIEKNYFFAFFCLVFSASFSTCKAFNLEINSLFSLSISTNNPSFSCSSIERFFDKGLTVLPALDAVAAETGASPGAVALAWLMRQPGIAAPIASASRPEQLDIQFEAFELELSPDQIDRLSAAGA